MNGERSGFPMWNQRLLDAFFSPASAGIEVFLQVSGDELDAMAPELGGDSGFIRAVRAGPSWISGQPSIVMLAESLIRQRKDPAARPAHYDDPGNFNPVYKENFAPTYLPILAALVRSAASQDENGFYAHLRHSLGLPPRWGPIEMARLEIVWQDLQAWTAARDDKFGCFRFRVLGGHSHVGVPKSQSIMSQRDNDQCSRLFALCGLRTGQALSPNLLANIKEFAREAHYLSHGFRLALAQEGYSEPIDARLRELFEDWDGTVPDRQEGAHGRHGEAANRQEGGVSTADKAKLCLSLDEQGDFPWRIHWRVPPLREAGMLRLVRSDASWLATMGDADGSTTLFQADRSEAARAVLAESAERDVAFEAFVEQDDDSCRSAIDSLVLVRHKLWVLVFKRDPFTGRYELREDALPQNGPAYLLAPERNVDALDSYLTRLGADNHSVVSAEGLPDRWKLACVLDCARLDDDQRLIPDGEDARARPRSIRFIGGRSVRRGASRQFLSYDLPWIELDAPNGSRVEADGLKLEEAPEDQPGRSANRVFQIVSRQSAAQVFEIRATSQGRVIDRRKLRVASDGGEWLAANSAFHLDRMGNACREGRGLQGVLEAETTPKRLVQESIAVRELGTQVTEEDGTVVCLSAAARFLDSIAQHGSLAYGAARDHLRRLLLSAQSAAKPTDILFELRGRGHIEIETNLKGHMVRIHAVPPALYELPVLANRQRVLGILGSLRLQQWTSLASSGQAWKNSPTDSTRGHLAAWRLKLESNSSVPGFALLNFGFHAFPALAIADWAASLDDVSGVVAGYAGDELGAGAGIAEKFRPNTCLFQSDHNPHANQFPRHQFFRIEDPETRLLHHVLSSWIEGRARYGFVRDSRWGVWIALCSFAEFVKSHGIGDAAPWPFPYSTRDGGTLWLPARIGVPVVLERALVLCNGDRPEVVAVEAEREPEGKGLSLHRWTGASTVARVSLVYDAMASGRWLVYRWVPRDVANKVAEKLGGVLADADSTIP